MTVISGLCVLPYLIKTNPGYILKHIQITVMIAHHFVNILKSQNLKPFKRVNFIVCELYLNFKSLIK